MGLHKKFNSSKQKLRIAQGAFLHPLATQTSYSHFRLAYGMTEVAAGALGMLPDEGLPNVGSVGRLLSSMEARLVDDDGNDVPQGENSAGELWLRGLNLMKVSYALESVRRTPALTSTHRDTSTTRLRPEKQSLLTGGSRRETL